MAKKFQTGPLTLMVAKLPGGQRSISTHICPKHEHFPKEAGVYTQLTNIRGESLNIVFSIKGATALAAMLRVQLARIAAP
jgi:hypothetical protein